MPYKILSLDGGGSWALIQARVLLDIYGDIRGHELCDHFIINDDSPCLLHQLKNSDTRIKYLAFPAYKEAKEKWMKDCM